MMNNSQQLGSRITILVGFAFLLLAISNPIQTGNSWWDKGKSMFETIGRSNQATEATTEEVGGTD